ncbi:hypothetical protein ONE63_009678 [Megalurothrips usitatus]|uniref:Uncharacterized protein n=1 Tax=Megalurothrips usitatus TaxID=439358 RepID=A0AAV7XMX6_9NEOP|nr:hypothetical protein ONE63_009678 [Megalurothrips usitatus]
MGKSMRSKSQRRNRARRREEYAPKELEKLKSTLAFEWNDQTEKAHLSVFHDIMNGPTPYVPGLEADSSIAKLHLTDKNAEDQRAVDIKTRVLNKRVVVASRALRFRPYGPPEDEVEETIDDKPARVYNFKTHRDQYGQYPPWMHRKEIISRARANRLSKQKTKKLIERGKIQKRPKGPSCNQIINEILHGDGEEDDHGMPMYADIKKSVVIKKTKQMMKEMYDM